uniref:Uncharacterized protein n=1 Tax=Tetradesmus obliquus TaxID=3088 RepID=A0A383VPV2_TETOB|eukprot:jgi/Sobl393_1/14398/SZX67211.1
MTWEPVSSLRGDATLDRFQLPKANILTTESGAITRLLDNRFTRRMIHPPYEALKETYTTSSSEPQCMQQQRQRHAAAAEFEQQVQQRRAHEEAQERQRKADLLAGLLQRPEYMTSDDNPLADCLTSRSSRPSSSRYTPRSCCSSGSSSRCTPRTADSSVPSSARSSSSGSSSSSGRPKSPDGVAARARLALRGHLAVGSLLPLEDDSQKQQQQQQPPQQQWQLGSAVMAAAGYVNEEAMRLKEQMIDLYPHGAPRSVVNEAKAQGVTLPSLGHASLLPPVPRRSFNKRW